MQKLHNCTSMYCILCCGFPNISRYFLVDMWLDVALSSIFSLEGSNHKCRRLICGRPKLKALLNDSGTGQCANLERTIQSELNSEPNYLQMLIPQTLRVNLKYYCYRSEPKYSQTQMPFTVAKGIVERFHHSFKEILYNSK